MIDTNNANIKVPDQLLNEKEASNVLSTTAATLKQSRYTGILFGKPSPSFIKMGRSTRYKLSVLLIFLEQFPEYQNTSEANEYSSS